MRALNLLILVGFTAWQFAMAVSVTSPVNIVRVAITLLTLFYALIKLPKWQLVITVWIALFGIGFVLVFLPQLYFACYNLPQANLEKLTVSGLLIVLLIIQLSLLWSPPNKEHQSSRPQSD